MKIHVLGVRVVMVALWLVVAAAVLPGRAVDNAPGTGVTFPFTPLSAGRTVYGLPLVRVRVNSTLTGTFLFDTGTNVSLVTDALAARLGLKARPALKDGHPFLVEGRAARSVVASSLQFGALRLDNVELIEVKRSQLNSLAQRPLDGIIGTNLMRSFAVLFDFPQRQITVWSPDGLTPEELKKADFADAVAVPLADPGGLFLYSVPVQFTNGGAQRRDDLCLDTGAEQTTLSYDVAVGLGLKPVGKPVPARFLVGSYQARVAPVGSLRVGDVSVSDLQVRYPVQNVARRPLLGTDVLSHFRVLLDFPGKKMYIQGSTASQIPPAGGKP